MSEKDIESIRMAAYYIWEKEGRPEGKDEEIWFKACNQLASAIKAKKPVAKKAVVKKAAVKKAVVKKTAVKAVVVKPVKPVAKVVAKPVAKVVVKPVAKVAAKPVAKVVAKPIVKSTAKVSSFSAPLKKSKISPVPVKTTVTKIITPLYGSVKK